MDKLIPVPNDTPKEWPDSLDACRCPYCTWPADPERAPRPIGDLLPDVLAEMRRREGR